MRPLPSARSCQCSYPRNTSCGRSTHRTHTCVGRIPIQWDSNALPSTTKLAGAKIRFFCWSLRRAHSYMPDVAWRLLACCRSRVAQLHVPCCVSRFILLQPSRATCSAREYRRLASPWFVFATWLDHAVMWWHWHHASARPGPQHWRPRRAGRGPRARLHCGRGQPGGEPTVAGAPGGRGGQKPSSSSLCSPLAPSPSLK